MDDVDFEVEYKTLRVGTPGGNTDQELNRLSKEGWRIIPGTVYVVSGWSYLIMERLKEINDV